MRKRLTRAVLTTILLAALSATWGMGADWPVFGHDPQRSGWASGEHTLNAGNVRGLQLLWKVHVKNQPESLTALTAPVVAKASRGGASARDVVYVAGSSGEIYALDAETGKILWSRELSSHSLPASPGMWLCPNNLNATPAADERRGLLYTIAADGMFYGLDLSTGAIRLGPIQFVPPYSKDWSLNLWNGSVYTTVSQGCGGARSGIYSISVQDPDRPVIHELLLARKFGAGIWGRGGATVGEGGRLFASTGDGPFDPADGEYGSSVIAVSPEQLRVVDYYLPANSSELTQYDLDISAAGVVEFRYRDDALLAAGGKEGVVYLLDARSLGGSELRTPLDSLKLGNDNLEYEQRGIWGGISSWRDPQGVTWLYVPMWGPQSQKAPAFPRRNGAHPHGSIMAFKVVTDAATEKPKLAPAWVSGDFDVPEPAAIANGVVFALSTGENTQQNYGPAVKRPGEKRPRLTDFERSENTHRAVLYALDAKSGKTLYQSGDAISTWTHFSGIAVADGRVYAVDHGSNVYCFGLKDAR
ncbi:MAG: PQQ-binding-like beta-propeller repeat protein [Terriglobia bacterium]